MLGLDARGTHRPSSEPRHPKHRLPDAELIRRSLTEPDTFAELYDRHAARLHRFVARRLDAHAAEDVVAEVFMAAFRRRGSYDQRYADAGPWLFGIAVKLIGRHRRSEVRMLRALARAPQAGFASADADAIDARLTAASAGRSLAAAIAEVPAGQRDVLLLAAWAEFSYEEIALALGLPLGTVRSRLSRARRRLRGALAAPPADHDHDPDHGERQ
jgi:RNA polymerase sigma-70 factor, ECF subfamily